METGLYVKAILALFFVLGLIALASFMFRKFVFEKTSPFGKNKVKSLSIEEISVVDSRRKLILIKRDDVGHLVMLGANSELLIESNIKLQPANENTKEDNAA